MGCFYIVQFLLLGISVLCILLLYIIIIYNLQFIIYNFETFLTAVQGMSNFMCVA